MAMQNIDQQLARFSQATVLCIGDLMLDEFLYGTVGRISPEAATPVIEVQRQEMMLGGAGNVARNVAALGANCIFVSVVGDDDAGRQLNLALAKEGRIESHLITDASRPTTRKVRFVSEHHSTHLLRADWERTHVLGPELEKAVIERALAAMSRAGVVVLSDYAKGVLTPKVVRTVIDAALGAGQQVIVNPKGRDYSIYRGATVVMPNRKELAEATRSTVATRSDLEAAASELARVVGGRAVLVTLSEDGMMLCERNRAPVHVPAYQVRVRDVSGAGDTAVAGAAVMLAVGADLETAMRTASACAAVVVGKRGIATATVAELRSRILPTATRASEEKIVFDWAVLDDRVADWRRQNFRIGFTNGCFDLLHPGHVKLLAEARGACDRLVVGLNSNVSVARLKGAGRPVQDERARAEVLAALEAVDLVVLFEDDTPLALIGRLRPKVLVKGADYSLSQVVGRELVEADGGEVVLVELVPGCSTTGLVDRASGAP
jgi:D-beta-D-heptose 7-phosphate kinase/D-beta-D-heptose 1-phosphate adenosyltransferase